VSKWTAKTTLGEPLPVNPKDSELFWRGSKPEQTLVEDLRGADVQLARRNSG